MSWSAASLRLHVESALAGRVAAPFRFREGGVLQFVSTGIAALDELSGGLPCGCLTEIYGPPCSGKTSILQSILAARTRSEACALVDAQDSFDPVGSQRAGVVLQRLLWIRCHGIDQALRSADLLLHGGGFSLIALDLSDVPARLVRQVQLNVWFRMRRAVENSSTVFLVLAQETNAKTCASLVLRVQKETVSWFLPDAFHTPGCLLDVSTHSAEMVRSFLRHKKPLFIDRPECEKAHFRLGTARLCNAEALPCVERPKERMRNPG